MQHIMDEGHQILPYQNLIISLQYQELQLLLELININMERPVQEAPDTKERLRLGRYRRWYGIRNKRRAAGEVRCEKGDKSRRPVHRNIMLSGSFFMPEGCVPGSGSGRNTEIFRSV